MFVIDDDNPEIKVETVELVTLKRRWNNELGDYDYVLFRKTVKKLVVAEETTRFGRKAGDLAWAQRQAAHYGIEIEGHVPTIEDAVEKYPPQDGV